MGVVLVKNRLGDHHKVLVFLFLSMYPLSVMASQGVFQDTTGFSLSQALYALFMGFWGALATFTQKWVKGETDARGIRIFVKDLTNSTLASSIALMICVHQGVSPALIGMTCSLAGYGGVSFLDFVYKRFINQTSKATG